MLQLIGCFSACSCTTLYSRIAKYEDMIDFRTSFNVLNRNYNTKESGCIQNYVKNSFGPFGMVGLEPLSGFQYNRTNLMGCFSPTLSNLRLRSNVSPAAISPVVNYRLNPSFFGGKGDKARYAEVTAASVGGAPAVSESGSGGRDMVDMAKGTWKSTVDAITYVGERAKEASNEVTPRVQQLLESQPYLRDVIVPVSGTLTGAVFAWVVLPGILKWLHMYLPHGSAALLSWPPSSGQVLYIKSFWGALDYPLRFLITFMAFSRIAVMVAPTTIASQYIGPLWRCAVIVSFFWFVHRWKLNVIAYAFEAKAKWINRANTWDKISSLGLVVLGAMAIAEAFGVGMQSILTLGGLGGLATASKAGDILGGLSVLISQPFLIGDNIKVGSVEGQVWKMGLTTTSLLSAEKFLTTVPNSMFLSQAVINKSRIPWRAMVTKIPFPTEDVEKIALISEDIKAMLRLHPKVYLKKEPPYCFLSRIERTCAELTLGCNLEQMSKDKLYLTEQDILLQSVQIIKKHGVRLGSTTDDTTNNFFYIYMIRI